MSLLPWQFDYSRFPSAEEAAARSLPPSPLLCVCNYVRTTSSFSSLFLLPVQCFFFLMLIPRNEFEKASGLVFFSVFPHVVVVVPPNHERSHKITSFRVRQTTTIECCIISPHRWRWLSSQSRSSSSARSISTRSFYVATRGLAPWPNHNNGCWSNVGQWTRKQVHWMQMTAQRLVPKCKKAPVNKFPISYVNHLGCINSF